MKIKTLIPFVVILALLAGLVAWQKMSVKPPAPIAEQIGLETLVPSDIKANDIARIELFAASNTEEKVVLERDGDAWRIASLYNAPVNQETLDGFIEKMLALKGEPRATADSDERLADYALKDDEAFHVCAYRANDEQPVINVLFGKTADFRTVFLRKADDKRIFVESTNLRREAGASDSGEGMAPKASKWLKTTLLELEKDKINKVALNYPDKQLVFERRKVEEPAPEAPPAEGEGEPAPPPEPKVTYEWSLVQGGFSEKYTDSEFQNLLTKLAGVAVTNAMDPEKKNEYGFDPHTYTLTVSVDDKDHVEVLGGRDKPGGDTYIQLVGAEPALAYQMSKFNFEGLFPQGSKLFALPEWTVDKETITRIEITRPEGRIVVVKEENKWRIEEPQLSLEVQQSAVDNIAAAAASLKPADYADAGVDVGAFETTVVVYAGETTRRLQLGQPSKHIDGVYVRFDDSEQTLVLARSDVTKLTPPARDLYALSLLDFDAEAVTQIDVLRLGQTLQLARNAEDPLVWTRTTGEKSATAEKTAVDDFVQSLNDFQVDNFMLDRTVDSVQADTIITVTREGADPVTLSIAPEQDDVYSATVSGKPMVFSVAASELFSITASIASLMEIPEEPASESAEGETQEAAGSESSETTPEEPVALEIPAEALVIDPAEAPEDAEAPAVEVAPAQ